MYPSYAVDSSTTEISLCSRTVLLSAVLRSFHCISELCCFIAVLRGFPLVVELCCSLQYDLCSRPILLTALVLRSFLFVAELSV